MSRIYEALQKAEAEKAVAARSSLAADQVALASAASSSIDPAGELSPSPLASPLSRVAAQSLPNASLGLKEGLGDITRRIWKPSLPHLPALLNYGVPVEQFRSLRSRLFELRSQQRLKTILVSSGVAQEGKSFVAANLAISLARGKDRKVLLIDGDMRCGTLHTLLGCEAQPGLPDYLSGRLDASEVMQCADTSHTGDDLSHQALENLTFIAGGDSGEEAADLSGNQRFQKLISAVESEFEWIIVDSSPVVPVSDAVNLARACDGVLLIARGGVTPFQVAQRAQTEFRASNILGFVLNAAEAPPINSHYYGYGNAVS